MQILNAAQRSEFPVVSPLAVLEEIRELCTQTTVYPFLQMESEGSGLKPTEFIDQVRQRWLDIALDELTLAVGLVTREQYDALFQRYLRHVSHQQRGEKLENAITGQLRMPTRHLWQRWRSISNSRETQRTFDGRC